MQITLIDPVTTARSLPVETRKKLRKGIGYPALGLITVAALTPPDIQVEVIDESVEDIDLSHSPDLVGITVQAPTAPYAYRLSSLFRKKGIPVVLGGIHVSLNPEEALAQADSIVVGEAELTWNELIQDFRKGNLKKAYKAKSLSDLDSTPPPRRDLLKKENYQMPYLIQASKGCPYGCEFCSLHSFVGYSPRYRRIENVVKEIQEIPDDKFLFADDNIYGNRSYTMDLFKAMIPLKKHWVAESTWHIAYDEEILTLAKQSGCAGLFIGFDSINKQRMIKKIPDSKNVEEVYINAIKSIQKKGIAVVAAFVFGLDNDDTSVFERSLRIAQRGGANLVNFSVLVPYPGTPIFNRLKKEGRIIEWDWSKYISPNVCFEPKNMSVRQVKEGTIWAQKEFYSLGNILKISFAAFRKLGWAMGLLSLQLNLAQKRNWGKGND
jgi:radical SAM superfamily enzyme YgiQ (UPF0313 family)